MSDSLVPRADRTGPAETSFAQARLWFADQMGSSGLEFVYPVAMRLRGPLDVPVLASALDRVVARHEALRTTFTVRDGQPFQVVGKTFSLGLTAEAVHPADLDREMKATLEVPFDLERGPVLRARLLGTAPEEHVLLIVIHHIAVDGWSMDIICRELGDIYTALLAESEPELSALDVQFSDIAAWERTAYAAGSFGEDQAYWRTALDGCPHVLNLPLDRPRPAVQSFAGQLVSFEVPAAVKETLDGLARKARASLYMALLAAFEVVLARWSGQSDFVVGAPVANREQHNEDLVGFFMNLLPLRASVDLRENFRELLLRVRESTLDAYDHQSLSFDRVVEEVAPERTLAHNPLVQIAFNMENSPQMAAAGLTVDMLTLQSDVTRYDLAVDYAPGPSGGLRFDVYYASDIFERRTVQALAHRYVSLLESVTADPDLPLDLLPAQDAAAEAEVLAFGAGAPTAADVPTVLQRLRAAVEAQPDAPAVVAGDEVWSFAELDRRADAVARLVAACGAAADDIVGVCLPRSPELLAVFLGILRAGAAYLPLDPGYPLERLRYLVADSGTGLVLTTKSEAHVAEAAASAARVVLLDEEAIPEGLEVADAAVHPDQCAYVIYTSGSSGRPKGVQVCHGAVARLLAGLEESGTIRRGPGRVGWNASPSFDASVQQWIRVCRGDTVVIVPEELRRVPEQLAAEIVRQRLTDLDLTPSHAAHLIEPLVQALVPGSGERLRLWIGGEQLPSSLWRTLADLAGRSVLDAVNVYGTTETTVDSTMAPVAPGTDPRLGSPLPGQSVRVLDHALHPVPPGTVGEIYLAGPALARGYLARPGLTATRFVPDPWAADGSRMYRTGDRARWRADGTLEYLGRADRQVKVNGFRVELDETEAVLADCPQTLDCAVVRREQDEDAVLAAYLRLTPDGSERAVREFVDRQLPGWMRPATYTVVDALPLTPAGKIDRAALAALAPQVRTADDEEAPRNSVEALVIRVCEEVLGVQGLRRGDHFFESGGHSLLAIRVVARLKRQARLTIPMTAIFENPVLSDLAAYVEQTIRERMAGQENQ